MRCMLLAVALVVAAALPAATPASADWLVMRDGSRVETKGPWEVRGAVVVFTLKNGTLGSVRAADADLDASQAATAEAAKPPAPAPAATPAPRKPAVTLTDADVKHYDGPFRQTPPTGEEAAAAAPAAASTEAATRSPAPAPAGGAAAPAAPPAPPPPPPERLKVTDWHQDLDASTQGATLVGQITNTSADFVQNVVVTAKLFDEEGKLIADANALLGARALQAGQGTNFRVTFPGVFHYASAKFEIKSFAFKSAPDA